MNLDGLTHLNRARGLFGQPADHPNTGQVRHGEQRVTGLRHLTLAQLALNHGARQGGTHGCMRHQLALLSQAGHGISRHAHHLQLVGCSLQFCAGDGQLGLPTLQLRGADHIGAQQLLSPVFCPFGQLSIGVGSQIGQLRLGQLWAGHMRHGLPAGHAVAHIHQHLGHAAGYRRTDARDLLLIGLDTTRHFLNRGQIVQLHRNGLEAIQHLRLDRHAHGVFCAAGGCTSCRQGLAGLGLVGLTGLATGSQQHHTGCCHQRVLGEGRRQVHLVWEVQGNRSGFRCGRGFTGPPRFTVGSRHIAPPVVRFR